MAGWLLEWRETFLRASDRAASTKQMYAGLMASHVIPVVGRVTLAQLSPGDITRVLLAMEQADKSASTRRNAYAALRAALDGAVANGLLATNPVVRVKRPSADQVEALSLTPAQVARLLDASLDVGIRMCCGSFLTPTWPRRSSSGSRTGRTPPADTAACRCRRYESETPHNAVPRAA